MDSQQDLGQIPIENLRLSRRTFNALRRRGVFTVGKLKELFQNNNLQKIYFIGQKSLDEVSNALNKFYREASNPILEEKISDSIFSLSPDIDMKDIDLAPVEILSLHASIRGALIKSGIKTIGDLRLATDGMILNINRIGPKMLIEIRQALKSVVAAPDKYVTKHKIQGKQPASQDNKVTATWAEITQGYFESERDNYILILLSRFGFRPKKLEEIASELGITRERVRQVQEAATVRFLKHVRFAGPAQLLERIHEMLSEHGESLSLRMFKAQLGKENLLGEFTPTLMSERISKIDPFETLICWLNLLSDS